MNQRQIGIIVLVIGIVLTAFIFLFKAQADRHVDEHIQETGTCFTPEGQCMHQENASTYVLAWAFSFALIVLGIYLMFFDRTYALFLRQQQQLLSELQEAKRKDEFSAYLAGFSEEEQQVIKAVHEQEGIKQSTLRYRTGIGKASLSLLLKALEEKRIISRKDSGKTKEVYLRKRF